jgi:hypothetical protein
MENKSKSSEKENKSLKWDSEKDKLMLDDSSNGDSNLFYQSNSKLNPDNKLQQNDFIDNLTKSLKKSEKSCFSNKKENSDINTKSGQKI